MGSSKWTFYINDFDGVMNFECQDGNIVTGIGGYHSNCHEDRRFKFRCIFLKNKRRGRCRWTAAYTNWDALWSKDTPAGCYLTGAKVFIIMAMSKFGYFSFLLPYLFEIIIKNILKLKLITYFNQGTFTLCSHWRLWLNTSWLLLPEMWLVDHN